VIRTGCDDASAGDLVVRVDTGSQLTLSAPIAVTTTGGLTKNGAGTLVIGAINAQTGITSIKRRLPCNCDGRGASARTVRVWSIRQGGTLDLNGVNTGTAIGGFQGAGTVTNSSTQRRR